MRANGRDPDRSTGDEQGEGLHDGAGSQVRHRHRAIARALAAGAALAAIAAGTRLVEEHHAAAPQPQARTGTAPATTVPTGAVGQLTVGDVAFRSDYDRDAFGQAWSDDVDVEYGHNGCDTRNDVLARDLVEVDTRAGTNGCVVAAGRLDPEPYTGEERTFTKAEAYQLQVDHVFALAAAWDAGAWAWSDDERRNFANDPLNLVLADGPLNQAKGASTPAEWLPPAPGARCPYAQRFAAVAVKYRLVVTAADEAAITSACSDRSSG